MRFGKSPRGLFVQKRIFTPISNDRDIIEYQAISCQPRNSSYTSASKKEFERRKRQTTLAACRSKCPMTTSLFKTAIDFPMVSPRYQMLRPRPCWNPSPLRFAYLTIQYCVPRPKKQFPNRFSGGTFSILPPPKKVVVVEKGQIIMILLKAYLLNLFTDF